MPKRLLQLLVVVVAGITMLGAGNPAVRFDKLGHNLMCTCSCGEILLECNHVGCPTSGPMVQELHAQLATGLPDKDILSWFAAKYGPIVLASPIRGGFDLVAWIVPFAVVGLGIAGIVLLLRLWQRRHARVVAALPSGTPFFTDTGLRERIRRETTYDP